MRYDVRRKEGRQMAAKKPNPSPTKTPTKTKLNHYFEDDLIEAVKRMANDQRVPTTQTAVIMKILRDYLTKHGYLK
jgi:hypothetical protein